MSVCQMISTQLSGPSGRLCEQAPLPQVPELQTHLYAAGNTLNLHLSTACPVVAQSYLQRIDTYIR